MPVRSQLKIRNSTKKNGSVLSEVKFPQGLPFEHRNLGRVSVSRVRIWSRPDGRMHLGSMNIGNGNEQKWVETSLFEFDPRQLIDVLAPHVLESVTKYKPGHFEGNDA
jgi:hypothetical protein